MKNLPIVRLRVKKEIPVLAGHPWVFSNAITEGPLDREAQVGDYIGLVRVLAHDSMFLGVGMYNFRNSIRVRMIGGHDKELGAKRRDFEKLDVEFFQKRFVELMRKKMTFLPAGTTGYRLVNADADWLPGLIVDMYGNVAVFQIHTAVMDLFRKEIVEALRVLEPCAVVERSDVEGRKMEGLEVLPVKIHSGEVDGPVEFLENGVRFLADVLDGQKTGFFLDQREARKKVGELAGGKKVLNLFSYTGGFGLYAALNGAKKVTTLDVSEKALELAVENFKLNGIEIDGASGDLFGAKKKCGCEFLCGDVFDYLQTVEPGDFDLIVCDPPAFAKSNDKLEQAKKAYIDLNKRCLEILPAGGMLVTSSCSGRVSHEDFRDILRIAAGRAQKDVQILASLSQPPDHTERICFTEGRYLKTLVVQVLD